MDLTKEYEKETGEKAKYTCGAFYMMYKREYVEWLERKLVNLNTIPDVIDTVCDNCGGDF